MEVPSKEKEITRLPIEKTTSGYKCNYGPSPLDTAEVAIYQNGDVFSIHYTPRQTVPDNGSIDKPPTNEIMNPSHLESTINGGTFKDAQDTALNILKEKVTQYMRVDHPLSNYA